MGEKLEVKVDVEPIRITSATIAAPFDQAKEALESRNYNIISLRENAQLRIQQGKNDAGPCSF